jgi:putative effector of murein hydrolase
MVTGIMGAIIGRFVLDRINITNPIARGCSLGMSAHVMGTTQALEEGEITGSFSALSIPVTGVLTILNLPLFTLIIDYLLN